VCDEWDHVLAAALNVRQGVNMENTTDWPTWKDAGKRVEVSLSGNVTIRGDLVVTDFFFDGQEEIPIFDVEGDDGVLHNFAGNICWKFI
jgi:hypothetical protein